MAHGNIMENDKNYVTLIFSWKTKADLNIKLRRNKP